MAWKYAKIAPQPQTIFKTISGGTAPNPTAEGHSPSPDPTSHHLIHISGSAPVGGDKRGRKRAEKWALPLFKTFRLPWRYRWYTLLKVMPVAVALQRTGVWTKTMTKLLNILEHLIALLWPWAMKLMSNRPATAFLPKCCSSFVSDAGVVRNYNWRCPFQKADCRTRS